MRIARYSRDGAVGFGAVEGDELAVIDRHPFERVTFTGVRHPLTEVRLLAPILPSKVVAIGRNYAAHADEMAAPPRPVLFLKPSTAVCGPGDPIQRPESVERLDFEGELAVVIGRLTRDAPRDQAMAAVFGYTCANDVTARDQQQADGQWARAKGYDTFCPLGPWIATDVDPSGLRLTTALNGVPKQDASTKLLLHDVGTLIEVVSRVMTLLPGDVLLTGTPEGVGPMEVGDEVSVTIDGIGTLTNRVVARG